MYWGILNRFQIAYSLNCFTTIYIHSLLGQPCRIYTKGDDKLQIHAKTLTKTPMADYFYNYFDLGLGLFFHLSLLLLLVVWCECWILDVLFDSQRHTIKKLILHTNTPHHHEFNRYAKVRALCWKSGFVCHSSFFFLSLFLFFFCFCFVITATTSPFDAFLYAHHSVI